MSAYLSPIGGAAAQFFNNQGVIAAGGLIYTYLAGTTTPYATWQDPLQATPNANPIVLNSYGRPNTEIWLQSGIAYKFVITDSLGNPLTPSSYDNISGIIGSNGLVGQSEWVTQALTPTYVSSNNFTVPGNQTSVYTVNRRIQFFIGSGTFYGYVSGATYSAGPMTTSVSIVPDSTGLDSTVTGVNYALLNGVNVSVPEQFLQQGVPINGTPIGPSTPSTGNFTTMTCGNVVITGGTISGIAGFSVPDFLYMNQGVS